MAVEVEGVDHIYITVNDLAVSESFYDEVMRFLDFRKGTLAVGGDPHCHYFNRVMQLTIRPAKAAGRHDPYAPGLHHLCLRVAGRDAVDEAHRGLRALGIEASDPCLYPQYADDYYATFFADPDGIRLEIVAMRAMRALVRDRWDELDVFEDPLSAKGLV
ncbi:MAG: bleomycin resistance protein [Myxococcales bacterium]|jgi:glyoxylase I family protein|nr:MAG: bleomycin resistance protein [Myxococcales bacterium]